MVEQQLPLFSDTKPPSASPVSNNERLGTFQDSLRAPIHRWFKYPAGFSYKLVEAIIEDYRLNETHWLLDPFVGCGTTPVVAKERGVNSIGLEAHPFVHWVATIKCFWEFDMKQLYQNMERLILSLHRTRSTPSRVSLDDFPELVRKCYSDTNLAKLRTIRDLIATFDCTERERDFFRLALTDTLRTASKAGTGWPYIAPTKYHEKQSERDSLEVFCSQVQMMYEDLKEMQTRRRQVAVRTELHLTDSRKTYPIEPESADCAVTSPPYLNNYDYADRTRLEMYFFGWAASWRDITEKVRDKLITAATTQIRRQVFEDNPLTPEMRDIEPALYQELGSKVRKLQQVRLGKGGKKSYDLMVAGYFNDMLQVLQQCFRVLKPGGHFVLVLGDSAPYGVHIPTEECLGRLALGLGFHSYHVQPLRTRGTKWGHNPQRHKVALKESILTIQK